VPKLQLGTGLHPVAALDNSTRCGCATVGVLLGHQAGLRLHFFRFNQHSRITQVEENKRPRLARKVDLPIGVYFVLA
jgi:hypothetical protein